MRLSQRVQRPRAAAWQELSRSCGYSNTMCEWLQQVVVMLQRRKWECHCQTSCQPTSCEHTDRLCHQLLPLGTALGQRTANVTTWHQTLGMPPRQRRDAAAVPVLSIDPGDVPTVAGGAAGQCGYRQPDTFAPEGCRLPRR